MELDKVAKQIIDRMPKDLSDLEKARYIYIELGKLASFDADYWHGNTKTQKRIYTRAMREPINFEKMKENRKIICITLSRMYPVLLKEIGIEAQLIQEDDDDPHVTDYVKLGEKWYKMDLQRDLSYIQTNRKTKHFGRKCLRGQEEISEEELERIDRKLGYISEEIDYTDNYLWMLKKAVSTGADIKTKMELILSSAIQYKDISEMKIVERTKYYLWLLQQCLKPEEYSKVSEGAFYRERKEEGETIREYTSCISADEGKDNYQRYLFSEKENKYLEITEETLTKFMEEGLTPTISCRIVGIKKSQIRRAQEGKGEGR